MKTNKFFLGLVLWALPLLSGAGPAQAQNLQQDLPATGAWAQGVPRAQQDQANELLHQGNDAFLNETDFKKAVTLYQKSLTLWNHPYTHYNLALALINLDKPLDAYEHLLQALHYGEGSLGSGKYDQAMVLKSMLENQLTQVEIVCDPADAVVMMGSERLPMVNGRYKRLMLPGAVSFYTTRDGYLDRPQKFALERGKTVQLRLKLYTKKELTVHESRWSPWKPWAVVSAGAAIAMGGGVLQWQARGHYLAVNRSVAVCASDPERASDNGCRDSVILARRADAALLNRRSLGAMAAGSLVLATGAVFVLINDSGSRLMDPDTYENSPKLAVMPLFGGGTTGIQATLPF